MKTTHDVIRLARIYAAEAHRHQTRKYTGEPYFRHCEAVAQRVAEQTDDPEVIAAAYLHDTVEDTLVTHNGLIAVFGNRVAGLVLELTDVYTPEDYPGSNRAERKAAERGRLARVSPEAKLIKLADIADNTKDIVANDPKFAKVYLREKAELLEVLI